VRIVVASLKDLKQRCKAGEFKPTDILVDADNWASGPYHCPRDDGREGVHHEPHLAEHANGGVHRDHPDTLVILSHEKRESVMWSCDTHDFRIARITLVGTDYNGRVPESPFPTLDFGIDPTKEVASGRIRTDAINHQYKVHFGIQQERNGKMVERLVDPDVWCSF
jgi:hypothetical protein